MGPNNAEKALGGELAVFMNFPFVSQQVSGPGPASSGSTLQF